MNLLVHFTDIQINMRNLASAQHCGDCHLPSVPPTPAQIHRHVWVRSASARGHMSGDEWRARCAAERKEEPHRPNTPQPTVIQDVNECQ
jgi:hypothetical protein